MKVEMPIRLADADAYVRTKLNLLYCSIMTSNTLRSLKRDGLTHLPYLDLGLAKSFTVTAVTMFVATSATVLGVE